MTRYKWVVARKAEDFPFTMVAEVARASRQAFHDWPFGSTLVTRRCSVGHSGTNSNCVTVAMCTAAREQLSGVGLLPPGRACLGPAVEGTAQAGTVALASRHRS